MGSPWKVEALLFSERPLNELSCHFHFGGRPMRRLRCCARLRPSFRVERLATNQSAAQKIAQQTGRIQREHGNGGD